MPKTIDDILNIPKSDKKYFDQIVWVGDFFPGTGYWEYGVSGLKNELSFVLKMECDFKKAKEIASDERRLFEYIKLCEPKMHRRLFGKGGE